MFFAASLIIIFIVTPIIRSSVKTDNSNNTNTKTDASYNSSSSASAVPKNTPPIKSQQEDNYPIQPIEKNCILNYDYDKEYLYPFKITVPTGNRDYYITLLNKYDHSRINMYITAGTTKEFEIPEGEYDLIYCCGVNWYGESHLFGKDTIYCKADTTLDFYSSEGYYNGHTIELIKQQNGNLSEEHLSEDFYKSLLNMHSN